MKTKIVLVSMFCGLQLAAPALGIAGALAAEPQALPQGAPRKLAQADVDAAAAAGLETVYKIKAKRSRSKIHSGPKHPKKGKGRKHFASGVSSGAAPAEGNTCCASSPM